MKSSNVLNNNAMLKSINMDKFIFKCLKKNSKYIKKSKDSILYLKTPIINFVPNNNALEWSISNS